MAEKHYMQALSLKSDKNKQYNLFDEILQQIHIDLKNGELTGVEIIGVISPNSILKGFRILTTIFLKEF
jgi:translation initiation factor RLI1